jgi:transcription initiation factor IIE alpha subunit
MEDKTENTFFAEKPEPVKVYKTVRFKTVITTDDKYICRVYFSLSAYNTLDQIQNAQVTVRNQMTNKTVLNSIKYPCEIMLKKIKYDEQRETNDKYYIEIKPEDLEGNNFEIDLFYKVQIRFTSISASDPGVDLDTPIEIQPIDE